MDHDDSEELRRLADNLGIATLRRHIFLCCDQTEPKCAEKSVGLQSWEYLKRRLRELGLSERGGIYRLYQASPSADWFVDARYD